MSREEIQKLLGGYATGTLTEPERRALFEAALEDQELFDALAEEQALRDLFDDPLARQQLLRALDPARESLGVRAWRWLRQPAALAAAASLATALLVTAVVWLRSGSRAPQETLVAQVKPPAAPASPAQAPIAAPAKVLEPQPPKRKPQQMAPQPAPPGLAGRNETAKSPAPAAPTPPSSADAISAETRPAPKQFARPKSSVAGGRLGGFVSHSPVTSSASRTPATPAAPAPASRSVSVAGGRFAHSPVASGASRTPATPAAPPSATQSVSVSAAPTGSSPTVAAPPSATQTVSVTAAPTASSPTGAAPPSATRTVSVTAAPTASSPTGASPTPATPPAGTAPIPSVETARQLYSRPGIQTLGHTAHNLPEIRAKAAPRGNGAAPPSAGHLGVRYGLLRKGADGEYAPVALDTVFQSGDAVRLRLEPNDSGYVYLFQRDAGGAWRLASTQRVGKAQRCLLPASGALQYGRPGHKELLLVFSRQEEPSLAELQTAELDALASNERGNLLQAAVSSQESAYAVDTRGEASQQKVAFEITLAYR